MAGLNFADSHNMVAYLEKSTENADFAEIVDFLNANPIRYALIVSPTIYVSCIEQFWSTAKIKTVNNETQIHAKVEGKTIVISKSSVRRDLQFDDEDEVNVVYDTPSHTKKIFANMRRQGKDFSRTITPLFSSMPAQQAYIGEGSGQPTDPQYTYTSAQLSNEEPNEAVTKERDDIMERVATTASSLEAEQDSGSGPRVNTLRIGEDRLKFKELMDLCTKLSDKVLDLETTKTTQAKKIASLKKRVKKLERKRKSKTPGMNLFKIGTSSRRSLGEEDVSKQGRNLKQEKQSLIFEQSNFNDEGFDANMDELFKDVEGDAKQVISAATDEVSTSDAVNTAGTKVNTASAPVTTVGVSVSTVEPITTANVNITTAEPTTPPTITTTIFEDEDLTIAQTLVKMRSEKSKVRGVIMQEPSETATRPTVPP
ncbi:hypothetical protein Tco_0657458 [Tanacetum coccineum]|uniref:Xylulose kinase-1 n=1 Tax=Tanacetum coccineum TaxID=301880 RepID=A0ABQ4XBM3_9ASTR